ncbi:MAG TPA: AMP-binding protein [Ilumatobacter sp.]|nr:AMP-binding protein [Ilumatobacter sp.]
MSPVLEHFDAAWNELVAPGSGFAMETIEVRGVPMRVFPAAPATMRAVWELAQLHGDKTYLVYEDERYTYTEIAARVRCLAHWLRDEHGVGSGDRVAVAMRNYPEWVISYWAVASLGAALVGMNAWWTPKEMAFGLGDSRPLVLIADDERVERALQVLDEARAGNPGLHLVSVRTDRELPVGSTRWDAIVAPVVDDPSAGPAGLPPADVDPDDDVTIFYTSGTTGFPKGAQLTHRGSTHNLYDIVFMSLAAATADAKAAAAGAITPKEAGEALPSVFMAPTPLFHVTACNCILHPATLVGGTVVLMYKWDAARAIELIERERVTNFSGVPTMSREMLQHPDWASRDTSSLKGLGGGGAAIQPDLVDKIDKALKHGAPATGYGLTETHGIITANSAYAYTTKPASCGRVVPVLDAKLVDEAGDDLAPGPEVLGELCVRGPVVIKGYLNRPEATAEAIREGWFRTGDIARIDEDGFVFLVDRAKDMVLRGGENVYCSEVEAAIYEHPAIAEAAVFGVPDDRLGESVAAAIVLRPGTSLSQADLSTFLGERIAAYKVPSTVWFRSDPLPQNANGKFLKRELKAELLDGDG